LYRDAETILARLGVALDVRSPARGLTLAAQQTVEIAKALSLQTRVLIMDEPTASLSAHEVAQLFKLVQNLRDQGVAILFISHRLDEVFTISDRITIFRDGKRISTGEARAYTVERAIREMVGREMAAFFHKEAATPGGVVVSVRGLSKRGVFEDINFEIRAGEVLGFAGLVGAGRTDVALALFGIAPPDAGEIMFLGQLIQIKSPEHATRLGIAYVPEDRRQQGLIMPLSIAGNISLPTLRRYATQLGLIDFAREAQTANDFRARLTIRSESIAAQAGKLSGGNQQKVVLSKWLNTRPKLLILDEPTRGIDVGAKAEVHAMINDLAREGLAILMISSDLPEVLGMSDRVLVMREGRQMGIFNRADATQEVVMTAAMGQMVKA
jgi:rhamnose transport system ATP-binding protein